MKLEKAAPAPLVALLAEGVDRNWRALRRAADPEQVALLAEGVDRNRELHPGERRQHGSPSSRRAWIEIEEDVAKN